MKKDLIIIVGRKGTGKDTIAKYLVSKGFIQFAIADRLKSQLKTFLTLVLGYPCPDFYDTDKEKGLKTILPDLSEFTIRKAMQWYGRIMKEQFGNFYWMKLLFEDIAKNNKCSENIVISDCRFLYEMKYIETYLGKDYNIHRIKVNRETLYKRDTDMTENSLAIYNDAWFDFKLDNNGTEKELQEQIDKILQIIS